LGDNRANSWDGRFWPGTHFVPDNQIIGRAFFRFWPLNSVGSLVSPDPTTTAQPAATPKPTAAP
ncbi:MAG: S26 family signal peptidase, partial [Synechococcus sp.]